MMRSLWTAGTGMRAQQTNLDVISNNLANVNTTGFKKSRTDFQDLMYQTLRSAGSSTGPDSTLPSGVEMGHGVKQVATQRIYLQGSMQETGNDLAGKTERHLVTVPGQPAALGLQTVPATQPGENP